MYQKCQYLRQRHKKGELYYYCAKHREIVEYDCYRECLDKCYKERAVPKAKKPIKKVSKKRKTVSEKTYNIVFERSQGRCQYCGAVDNLQLHHVRYRSERKDLIDDPDNCLMLCHKTFSVNRCHNKVHNNKKKYQPILLNILEKIKRTS